MTELAVLVPVLSRPQNVAPLIESFLRGCPAAATLKFLVDTVDDPAEFEAIHEAIDAPDGDYQYLTTDGRPRVDFASTSPIRDADKNIVSDGYYTWPQRINFGVRVTNATWYLCAADDVTFEPGWWEATLQARNTPGIGVIGTNDAYPGERGNPAVAAGCHTCHPLISREYITGYGTVDEPGTAVHGSYSHWYVDNELVRTAMARKAWVYVREAVIRHNHFYWGRGEWDDTYAKGEANSHADQMLWESRLPLIEAEEERCRPL